MIVEDGTGMTDAQSYIDITYADTYHALRANTDWTSIEDDNVKIAALVKATDYIDRRWGTLFVDEPLAEDQALAFPRATLGMPVPFKNAVAEYALRSIVSPLLPDPDVGEGAIVKRREKTGPIEEEIEYGNTHVHAISPFKPYPEADCLIQLYLEETSGVYR